MTGAAEVRVRERGPRWRELRLPGADRPVGLLPLHDEGRGGPSVQAVDFPPGWSRPGEWHVPCAEQFVVLRGSLTLSGVEVRAGDHAVVPAGALRAATTAGPGGCLAVAWFAGPPRWRSGSDGAGPPEVNRRPLTGLTVVDGAGRGVALESGLTGPADVVTLDGRWLWVPSGVPVPVVAPPALVRVW
jgi:hypothetical protein